MVAPPPFGCCLKMAPCRGAAGLGGERGCVLLMGSGPRSPPARQRGVASPTPWAQLCTVTPPHSSPPQLPALRFLFFVIQWIRFKYYNNNNAQPRFLPPPPPSTSFPLSVSGSEGSGRPWRGGRGGSVPGVAAQCSELQLLLLRVGSGLGARGGGGVRLVDAVVAMFGAGRGDLGAYLYGWGPPSPPLYGARVGPGETKSAGGGEGGVGGDDGHGWVCGATSVLGDLGQEKRWGL